MTYSVEWMPNAMQFLTPIWLAAADRNTVTGAIRAIDAALASAPDTTGAIVFDTVREYEYPPLGVEFEVIAAGRRVLVLTAWDAAEGRPAPTGN